MNEITEKTATLTGETSKTATGHRLQLDFSEKAFEKLTALREKGNFRSNAELVRNALRLFEWFMEQKEQNAKIHIVKGNEAKEIELIF